MRRPRPLIVLLSALSAFLVFLVPVAAQEANGSIRVEVLDEEDLPFPGATVALTNKNGTYPRQVRVTSADGAAFFPVVASGKGYQIQVEVAGYAPVIRGDLEVPIKATTTVRVKLNPEMVENVVVLGREDTVDLEKGGTQTTTFSDEFIDDLPVLGRNYQAVLSKAPGVNDVDGDGNPNVHGARERDFKATIDGVSNVDPLTGTFMSNINPDSIAEIEVVTSGAGAEYGGATGGFARVITKSGGNDFEGVFNFFYRSSKLDGNGATDIPSEEFDYERIQPSLNFTGPIVRNHLWFAVNHEYIKDQDPIVFVDGGSVTQTIDGWRHLDKFTWQVSARNKLQFTYSADPLTWGPLGVSTVTPAESGYNYEQGGPTYQLRWTVPFSPTTSWDALIAFSDTGISWTPTTQGEFNACVTDPRGELAPAERFGQAVSQDYCLDTGKSRRSGSFLSNFEDTRQRWTYELKGEKFVPEFLGADHRFNIGMNVEDVFYSYNQQQRPFSTFLPVQASDFPGLNFGDQAANKRVGGLIFRDTALVPNSNPFSIFPVLFDQTRSADAMRYALWIEDSFRPIPNLSLRIGFRFSREEINSQGYQPIDPAAENQAFNQVFNECWDAAGNNPAWQQPCRIRAFDQFTGYQNEIDRTRKDILKRSGNIRAPEKFTVVNNNIDPRFSISWDPWNNAKTKFYATWGRYHGDMFLLPFIAEQGPDFVTDRFDVSYRGIDDDIGELSANQTFRTPFSISQIDRNVRSPYNDEFTIGVEREVAAETSIAVTYLNRKFKDQLQDIDINHRPKDQGSTCTGSGQAVGKPDGEFDDCGGLAVPVGVKPGIGGLIWEQRPDGYPDLFIYNPLFNQIFFIGNFNESQYEAVQFELRRRFYKNWEMEASYVWSEATGQAEDYNQGLGDDPTTVQDEQGFLSYDQRHLVKVNGRTYLPWWGGFRLGTSISWQSGLPYSITEVQPVLDAREDFGGSGFQFFQNKTVYPSRQRNDERNVAFWTIDINFQKEFQLGPTVCSLQLDVFNLLNDDVMWVRGIQNGRLVATRRFGRRFQAAVKVNF
jgi:hypothetical protein